jgi:hypothetical protein
MGCKRYIKEFFQSGDLLNFKALLENKVADFSQL